MLDFLETSLQSPIFAWTMARVHGLGIDGEIVDLRYVKNSDISVVSGFPNPISMGNETVKELWSVRPELLTYMGNGKMDKDNQNTTLEAFLSNVRNAVSSQAGNIDQPIDVEVFVDENCNVVDQSCNRIQLALRPPMQQVMKVDLDLDSSPA